MKLPTRMRISIDMDAAVVALTTIRALARGEAMPGEPAAVRLAGVEVLAHEALAHAKAEAVS
jgi:hypothetical protein